MECVFKNIEIFRYRYLLRKLYIPTNCKKGMLHFYFVEFIVLFLRLLNVKTYVLFTKLWYKIL